MALKKLNQFVTFDFNRFMSGKELTCIGVGEWLDYDTRKHLGMKVEVAITKDQTRYDSKPGESVSNVYEKLTLKVKKDVNPQLNSHIVPVNAIAKAYGENGFTNKLSITCDDIKVMP